MRLLTRSSFILKNRAGNHDHFRARMTTMAMKLLTGKMGWRCWRSAIELPSIYEQAPNDSVSFQVSTFIILEELRRYHSQPDIHLLR